MIDAVLPIPDASATLMVLGAALIVSVLFGKAARRLGQPTVLGALTAGGAAGALAPWLLGPDAVEGLMITERLALGLVSLLVGAAVSAPSPARSTKAASTSAGVGVLSTLIVLAGPWPPPPGIGVLAVPALLVAVCREAGVPLRQVRMCMLGSLALLAGSAAICGGSDAAVSVDGWLLVGLALALGALGARAGAIGDAEDVELAEQLASAVLFVLVGYHVTFPALLSWLALVAFVAPVMRWSLGKPSGASAVSPTRGRGPRPPA